MLNRQTKSDRVKLSFEVGNRYKVFNFSDVDEFVLIAYRTTKMVKFSDGREFSILSGVAPNGSDEEVLRIDEREAFAAGGVVRACQKVETCLTA
jgi:hypothetical protein